ncbi:RagB/SusD family nutrient uptake outer membrane protein [Pedobacter sp. HMF7647]|uniref:RagB/SusD family nutrient uptake outer membrane protein n=1 Tax=Hufsiella arboris TaxID=2695275 RepID=A0A7K1YF35_9SPHI|nr:RagB/SusD family nutrient uptake outer membrane protein [Hufsiella arboris]MXV53192.1 RagB/SusD family nutrient uptake outer membrane protein [Hufsiella arboris]
MKKKFLITGSLAALLLAGSGCTDLKEELYGSQFEDNGAQTTSADLAGVYSILNGFTDQANLYALEEHSTDEMMGPTRGTDWDDFGTWRKLHQHTWDPSHNQVFDTFNQLTRGVYNATLVYSRGADNQVKGEAAFLRAFFMFYMDDLYGKQPFREASEGIDVLPKVFTRKEGTDFIIKDLEFAEANLKPNTPGYATKEAADFLLAKMYLNKAVYYADPQNPGGPYTFAKADMDQVIAYCNKVIASGKYQIAAKYFDNFTWTNTTDSKELIFVRENTDTDQPGNSRNRTYMGNHYNQTPGGWNGFTTLADFYSTFENGDQRKGGDLPGFTNRTGEKTGFNIGQQFGPDGKGGLVALKDRSGQPLIFTPNVNLNYATEAEGIRVIKYPLNPDKLDNSQNDYVFFRYADLLLMKAEAILRGGTDPTGQTALSIVNSIRTTRGASTLSSIDEVSMLAERGRELYYEGWRRNDLIRFGKFNDPVDQRPNRSAGFRVVYPLPQRAVDANPNLTQNVGY